MEHVITTYGGGELFTLVFDAIAALFKEDRTGMVMSFIRIGLIVGSVYTLMLMFVRSSLQEGAKWFFWVVVATNLLFLPKTTIFIYDPLTKVREKVDHVPFALGAFAGMVSQIGRAITEKVETAFTLPDYMPYHKHGTVFASSLMSQVGQFRIVDPAFKANMEQFVNQCVVYAAMIGHKYTLSDLQNTPDIWALVKNNASPVLGFLYKEGKNPGTIVTCKVAAENLEKLWKDEIAKATLIYGSRVQNQPLTKNLFFTHLHDGYKLLSDISKSAEDILKQEMMINAIEESSNNKLSELGAAHNYAATKALLQQRSAYAVAGEIAAKTLPLFKNVIEALSYALFIFIVVLALLPNGWKILLTYFGILVWTQLWAPLYAVLNLIMTLYGKAETTTHAAKEGLTLLNSSAIINANADMVTLAAWLSVSIPFISYGILKQGAAAFVGLAQHLGSAMQSAASGAAAETVSGNISLGNVSMGNQAYQNTSAFQHNTSPSYNASQFKSMGADGIETTTFAGGKQSFNDLAQSHLSVQIMGTENTNYAEQQSFNQAESVAKTKSAAAIDATEASLQSSRNFMTRLGTDKFKGEEYSKNTNASEAQSLQKFNNFVKTIQEHTDLNETQAGEVALAVGMGGSLKFFSGDIRGSFSSVAARQKGIQDAQSIATQTGYSESTEKVVAAALSLSEGTRDSKGVDLDNSALASLNRAKGLREEASVAQNKVDTISKDMSSSQSKGVTISKELTQEVLEFIAHQPANPGPNGSAGGQIGNKEARRILEHGGEERAAYINRFQEQNSQYAIHSINMAGAQQTLNSQYEAQAQHQRSTAGVQAQHDSNIQGVQSQAHAAGLDKTRTNLETTSANTKQAESPQKEASSYGTQSVNETGMGAKTWTGMLSASSPQYEGQAQSQAQSQSSVGTQAQYASHEQGGQNQAQDIRLNKINSDKENIGGEQVFLNQKKFEHSQTEDGSDQSVKDFVEQQFKNTDNKIEAGKKPITDQGNILQDAAKESKDKTLMVTAGKNAFNSTVEGVSSAVKDIGKAIEKLPPPPPIIFP
ncbi:MAG: conjugal transfer protein TraG N-terminal domain-containing protein [Alphaproteobacteria bacterium]|nr:conjugal transfer protein TraG N-terminal domain-containing protein [Alphaproteobacteria bacterium]